MARAIEACVHCGFCLPACPTYRVLGEEMDSPRGRILLMKSALEGSVATRDTLPFVDRCLGCLACVSACPSGVRYDELLPLYRGHVQRVRRHSPAERLTRTLVHLTLPSPALSRLAFRVGRIVKPLAARLPGPLAAMLDLLPASVPKARPLPALTRAIGKRRARVALLPGCVQSAVAPEIGWATVRVLAHNGVEVVVPADHGCCGALDWHTGRLAAARDFARRALVDFPVDVDAVITDAAGCGSAMKEYGLLFEGESNRAEASSFAARVKDVSEFLIELGPVRTRPLPAPLTLAYHDACHLAHAQRITSAPRALLSCIENVTLLEVEESDVCCGSAGTYNIEQPALAARLGERKARHILATQAQAVVMGNIGCMIQLRSHLTRLGASMPVLHTVEVLHRAYDHAQDP